MQSKLCRNKWNNPPITNVYSFLRGPAYSNIYVKTLSSSTGEFWIVKNIMRRRIQPCLVGVKEEKDSDKEVQSDAEWF